MAIIISFANQKGGVGKTTLCTTFANYLSEQSKQILLLDCDSQQSISEKRKSDALKYPNASFLYNVQHLDLTKTSEIETVMPQLKKLDGIILLDTPGHLSQQGLIPLFVNSDYIICPYQYDSTSIHSTITFLRFFHTLKKKVPSMQTKMLLVANKYDKRIGKAEELQLWKETEQAFSKYGEILPKIDIRADMQRYNTLSLIDNQKGILYDTYNRILEIIEHE